MRIEFQALCFSGVRTVMKIVRLGWVLGLALMLGAGLSACRKPTPPGGGNVAENENSSGGDNGSTANDNQSAGNGNDGGDDGSSGGQGDGSGNDNGGENDNADGGNDNASGGGNDNDGGGDPPPGENDNAGENDNTGDNANANTSSASAWLFNMSDWKNNPLFASRPDDGRKTRLRERFWASGKVREQEEVWEDPAGRLVHHGVTVRWHESGTMAERWTFVDGRPDGSMEQYYSNGQPRTFARWKGGKLDGVMISWDEKGRVTRRAEYADGELVSSS
ncbi:MAG: hypothetical protein FLDDKLPJ_02279 [Phycisphaerae bacterium]|nr:hypothetical protein [Phycisphaerae bacterium]